MYRLSSPRHSGSYRFTTTLDLCMPWPVWRAVCGMSMRNSHIPKDRFYHCMVPITACGNIHNKHMKHQAHLSRNRRKPNLWCVRRYVFSSRILFLRFLQSIQRSFEKVQSLSLKVPITTATVDSLNVILLVFREKNNKKILQNVVWYKIA